MCQLDNCNSLRPEKQQQRYHPKPDSYSTIGGDTGHNIQIENSNDKQQHQIKASKDALQVRLIGYVARHGKSRVIETSVGIIHQVIGPPGLGVK